MTVERDTAGLFEDHSNDVFGMNPPRGVYFYMEFEHNLSHPLNRKMDPEKSSIFSNPQRTMAEARALTHAAAVDWATQIGVDLIPNDIEVDEDGEVQLPMYMGVSGDDEDDPTTVVFQASVRFFDYRGATIH